MTYPVHVPNEWYIPDDEMEEHKMLRLLGILALGNMVFGGRRYHRHHHRRHGSFLGRSLLLGALAGLFVSRANQNRNEEA